MYWRSSDSTRWSKVNLGQSLKLWPRGISKRLSGMWVYLLIDFSKRASNPSAFRWKLKANFWIKKAGGFLSNGEKIGHHSSLLMCFCELRKLEKKAWPKAFAQPIVHCLQCRWLVASVGCDLSLVCDLGVNSPGKTISRDGRDTWCPPQEDYLRLEGYDGAYDTKYCGKERVSIKMKGPLTLSFVSQVQRSKRQERQGFINGLLQGFNCQITCKNSTNISPVQFPSKPKPSSDNSSTTSTQKPTTQPPTTSPKPQPSLNHTVPEQRYLLNRR